MYKLLFALYVLAGNCVFAQRVAPGVAPQTYQQPQQHPQHPPGPPQYQQQQVPQHQQVPQQYQQQQQQNGLPPGVNPQHYQPQQQVQYQQVPVHQQQQIPVQQQVPVAQHQQVPIHQQQAPVHQGHGEYHAAHATHGQVLNAANIAQEKDHIQEHLHVPIDTSKMSEAELQFHYFKMHDSDNNNKLDGCELIKSLIHWHVHDHNEKKKNETHNEHGAADGSEHADDTDAKIYTDENLSEVVDNVINMMDLNKDGYVDYTEYRKAEEYAKTYAEKNKN